LKKPIKLVLIIKKYVEYIMMSAFFQDAIEKS